uniref:Acyl-CoA dehydrogenase/oxidase N-terminal domain-containing protein n=1 Tax=Meloidogyne floridensis TaxID=298350 RepID=A0A915NY88_9BILA
MLVRNTLKIAQNDGKFCLEFIKRNLSITSKLQGNGFNLDFSSEQKQLQQAVSKFTAEEIIPKAAHYDQTMKFPWEIIKKAHANGFMNVDIPAEYGFLFN